MATTFRAYLTKLQLAQEGMPEVIAEACRGATLRAVEAATEATPPKGDTGRGPYIGTNTVTGQLKQHWATDSEIEPIVAGNRFTTELKNDMQYASYVNDGHRMDRHFVPGLYVNPYSNLLEYDPAAEVGLVVGTKTSYVKGEFMTDKAKEAYRETLEDMLKVKVKELLLK